MSRNNVKNEEVKDVEVVDEKDVEVVDNNATDENSKADAKEESKVKKILNKIKKPVSYIGAAVGGFAVAMLISASRQDEDDQDGLYYLEGDKEDDSSKTTEE